MAVAGIGSLACIRHSEGMLTSQLQEDSSSTGSNVAWLQAVLPEYSPEQTRDFYLVAI